MFEVLAAGLSAEGTASIIINRCTTVWGPACRMLSDIRPRFCSSRWYDVGRLLGVRKVFTSSSSPHGNGGAERANHTISQMLAMVVHELQNNWEEQLPYVPYKTSVNAATALSPNEVLTSRLPCLPLTVFERTGFTGLQNLVCDFATDRQQCLYDIVRDHRIHIGFRVDHQNSALFDAPRGVPKLFVGG